MNRAINAYQVLGEPVAGLAGLGALSGLAEFQADVQSIIAGVASGQIDGATDIRLQIELRSRARGSAAARARLLNALRTIPGFYDPLELFGEPGVSGRRHWEIGLPAGELGTLGQVPDIGTVRLAPGASLPALLSGPGQASLLGSPVVVSVLVGGVILGVLPLLKKQKTRTR